MIEYENRHEQNRKKVCAPCGNKIKLGDKKPEHFFVNETICDLIREFICPTYSVSNSVYPLSICGTCRLTLQEYKKKNLLENSK